MLNREAPSVFLVVLAALAVVLIGLLVLSRSGTAPPEESGPLIDPDLIHRPDLLPPSPPSVADPPPDEAATEEPASTAETEPVEAEPEEAAEAEPQPIELAMQQPPGEIQGWVQNTDGLSLTDAEVKLVFEQLVEGGAAGPDLRTRSEAAGAFHFREVPPGSWTVTADHPEYALGTTSGVRVSSHELTSSVEVILESPLIVEGTVKALAGGPLEGADVILRRRTLAIPQVDGQLVNVEVPYRTSVTDPEGKFTLDRAAPGANVLLVRLDGYVTERKEIVFGKQETVSVELVLEPSSSVGGRIRTTGDRPVAGAEVQLLQPGEKGEGIKTNSSSDGSFLVSGLRGGRTYRLFARAKGFAPTGPVEVEAGRQEILITLASGGSITGTVRRLETGLPADSIPVLLLAAEETFPITKRTVSESAGLYVFEDLPSGKYNLHIASDYLTSEPKLGVEVKIPELTSGVDFAIYPGRLIEGIVVEGSTGERVNSAKVDLSSRTGPDFLTSAKSSTTSDEIGNFLFENLPYGLYDLEASADGYLRYPGPEARASVTLSEDERGDLVTLFLSRGGTITGSVVTTQGSPVNGAAVQVFNAPGSPSRVQTKNLATVSDSAGGFQIEGIPIEGQTDLVVSAWAPGFAKGKSDRIVLTNLLPSNEALIELGAGSPVIVRVVDTNGGGVAEANVSLRHDDFPGDPEPENWRGVTDTQARFVVDHMPPGRVNVSASKEGHISAGSRVDHKEEKTSQVTLTLEPATTIEGTVYDDIGQPVTKGSVKASANRGVRGGGRANIEEDGSFLIDGLGEGEFTLEVEAQRDTPTGTHSIRKNLYNVVSGGGAPPIEVPMNGALEGAVLDADTAEPIKGASVTIRTRYDIGGGKKQDFRASSSLNDPPGRFLFESIPPGTYTLSAGASGYLGEGVEDLEVTSPGLFSAGEILLKSGGRVRARLISQRTGEPVAGAKLTLDPGGRSGKADGKGELRISSIDPGIYNAVADHPSYLPREVNLIQVTADSETDAGTIELEEGARLIGHVEDGYGRAVDGASVMIQEIGTGERNYGKTGSTGRVEFEGLAPGGYGVTATGKVGEHKVSKSIDLTVASTRETHFEITLYGQCTLEGLLLGPAGSDLARAEVSVYPLTPSFNPVLNGRVQASIEGNWYRAEDLAEGQYLALARAPSAGGEEYHWHTTARVAYPGGRASLTPPSQRVSGHAIQVPPNISLSGLTVRLRGLSLPQSGVPDLQDWWQWKTTTDEEGYFEFRHLYPGTYELVATGDEVAEELLEIFDLPWAQNLDGFDLVFGEDDLIQQETESPAE